MMRSVSLAEFPDMPFMVGHQPGPCNPPGVPNTLPFALKFDQANGFLFQGVDAEVETQLARCYASGSLLGTATDDTELGRPYAQDFLRFIEKHVGDVDGCRSLEIGAGRGYLMRLLSERGADIVGLEPGSCNEVYWKRHGVNVVNGTFPDSRVRGPFDLIVAFCVLEHIRRPLEFLQEIASSLSHRGNLLMAVPHDAVDIGRGDPSMLIHEHFSYFTSKSLRRVLARVGLAVTAIEAGSYGGGLYCAARKVGAADPLPVAPLTEDEFAEAARYGNRCVAYRAKVDGLLKRAFEQKRTVGIFCPSRAVNVLPATGDFRFFDDDPELTGRFYPPFRNVIENRKSLLDRPVDDLWIMSHTFGPRLADELREESALARVDIRTVDEIFADEPGRH